VGSFLYHIPDLSRTPNDDDLTSCGLLYLERVGYVGQLTAGPSERPGVVFCGPGEGTRSRYEKDSQTWEQCGDRLWIGFDRSSVPTPQDLARTKQLKGETVKTDVGEWLVPIARSFIEQDGALRYVVELPQKLRFIDNEWQRDNVVERYAPLWEMAEEAYSQDITLARAGEIAVAALQANYSIGNVEADILGILSDETLPSIVGALNDETRYLAIVKKKLTQSMEATSKSSTETSDICSSQDGEMALTVATAQQ
jgi:hypothetical protein